MRIFLLFFWGFLAGLLLVRRGPSRDHHGIITGLRPEKVPRKSREEAKQKAKNLKIRIFIKQKIRGRNIANDQHETSIKPALALVSGKS